MQVPAWLAAALVILLGLALVGVGFAIGRATDNGHGGGPPVIVGPGPGGFGARGRIGGLGGGFGSGGGTTSPPATSTTPSTAA